MIDTTSIKVKGGSGGTGVISFKKGRRGATGGADGGDGGSGGDVVFQSDASAARNLDYFRRNRLFVAVDGKGGASNRVTGKSGDDVLVTVPLGVAVYRIVGGEKEFVARFYRDNVKVVVARGGKGGRGNLRFSSASIKKPLLSEAGEDGEVSDLLLRLSLLADVAFLGWQNSGKSSLMKAVTNSKVSVTDYPFSTIEPALGAVKDDISPFTVMDTPSIVEGSSNGVALGMNFMRHVKEANTIVFVVDASDTDAANHFRCVLDEVVNFDRSVLDKHLVVSLCKIDCCTGSQRDVLKGSISACSMSALGRYVDVVSLSALTGEGVGEFIRLLRSILMNDESNTSSFSNIDEEVVLRPAPTVPPRVEDPIGEKVGERMYRILHKRSVRIARRSNLDDWTARIQFIGKLREMGVIQALEGIGLQYGDDVEVDDWEFTWE